MQPEFTRDHQINGSQGLAALRIAPAPAPRLDFEQNNVEKITTIAIICISALAIAIGAALTVIFIASLLGAPILLSATFAAKLTCACLFGTVTILALTALGIVVKFASDKFNRQEEDDSYLTRLIEWRSQSMAQLKEQHKSLSDQFNAMQTRLKGLEVEVEQARDKLSLEQSMHSATVGQLTEFSVKFAKAQTSLVHAEARNKDLQSTVTTQQSTIKQLNETKDDLDRQILKLQEALEQADAVLEHQASKLKLQALMLETQLPAESADVAAESALETIPAPTSEPIWEELSSPLKERKIRMDQLESLQKEQAELLAKLASNALRRDS